MAPARARSPSRAVLRHQRHARVTSLAFVNVCVDIASRAKAMALVTAGEDGATRAWDVASRRERWDSSSFDEPVIAIARVGDDTEDVLAHTRSGAIVRMNVRSGTRAMETRGRDVASFCKVASDERGRCARAMDSDGGLEVLRTCDGEVVMNARARGGMRGKEDGERTGMATCCAFVAGAEALFAGYEDGSVILWRFDDNGAEAKEVWRRRTHREAVLCVAVDKMGEGAVTGGADGATTRYAVDVERLKRINVGTMREGEEFDDIVRIVRTHAPYASVVSASCKQPGVGAVAIRGDGKIVACGCWDGKIRVYEYKAKSKGRILAVLKYHENAVTDVAFAPDGSLLASAARDGDVALWEIFPNKNETPSTPSANEHE